MRAIILCAGLGSRFRPLSWITPKSLTPIYGKPMVERTIGFLHEAGIKDISLVAGYKKEAFLYLKDKFGIEIFYNPQYESTNNNTSLNLVKDKLDNAFIVDGDLFLLRNIFLEVDRKRSSFVSQETTHGQEWELFFDENKKITGVKKDSASGFGMVGVSYWEGNAAKSLIKELDQSPSQDFWEDSFIRILDQNPVYISSFEEAFVQEIDKVKDALDMGLLTHKEVASLACSKRNPTRLKGLTNSTWKICDHEGREKCLRIPGVGTESFIKREDEPVIISYIKNKEITPETDFYPEGLKVTDFLSKHRISDQSDMNKAFFDKLVSLLKILHELKHSPDNPLEPYYIKDQILLYEEQSGVMAPKNERDWLMEKAAYFDEKEQVLCHRDLLLENIMVSGDGGKGMQLIDFEYAGFTYYLWDAASLILEAGIKGEVRQEFVDSWHLSKEDEDDLIDMEILVDYVWGMWGTVNNYEDYAASRLRNYRLKLEERTAR